MDFGQKKITNPKQFHPLPLNKTTANFNGYTVVIDDYKQMENLNSNGTFGKGNLSRNYPENPSEVEIVRERVFVHRKHRFKQDTRPRKLLVVPDSDSENDDYLTDMKVKYEIDRCGQVETLNLSLQEAYFLAYEVKCLDIRNEGELLEPEAAWKMFQEVDKNFVRNYVVYYYYRAKNWVVKLGIKFGGDFVLYKGSPQLYHADYVVIIDVINEDKSRSDSSKGHMDVKYLHGVNRLCETAGKELLICQLIWPRDLEIQNSEDISKVSIKEVIMKRWILESDDI